MTVPSTDPTKPVQLQAVQFLIDHGQYLFDMACGGQPRTEVDLDLALVMRALYQQVDNGTEEYETDEGIVKIVGELLVVAAYPEMP